MLSLLLSMSLVAANGDALVRVQTPTPEDVATVRALGLDVWTEVPTGPWLDVRLQAGDQARLDITGLDYEVREPDLGPRVAQERLRLESGPVHGGVSFFSDYAPLPEIEAYISDLAADSPLLTSLHDIGDSVEGRNIWALEISNAPADAPVIMVDAGQHAREWISMASATCLADRLVRNNDPRIANLRDTMRVIVVPVVNPDGYVHSWEEDRYWRKNRRPPEGVDLNRNFSVAFGGPGASGNPDAGNYHGPSAFSEPESTALRDLAMEQPNLVAWLDVHSYGQLVLYPWGFQATPAPADAVLEPAAQALASGLAAPEGTEYIAIPGVDLYPAAGTAMDWAYGELGLYAYVLELRPGPENDPRIGFVLPPEQIVAVCDELLEGVLGLSEHLAGAIPPGAGDDGGAGGGESSTGLPPDDTTSSSTTATPQGSSSSTTGELSGGTAADTTGPPPSTTGEPELPMPGSSSSGSSTTGTGSAADADGCSCTTGPGAGPLLWLLLLVARRRPD